MDKKVAQEIASFLAGKSHRLSGREANEFFQLYKSWINPKAKTQPCGCNPNEWKRMMEETYAAIDSVLATETISLVVYELPSTQSDEGVNNTIEDITEVDQVTQDEPKGKAKRKTTKE